MDAAQSVVSKQNIGDIILIGFQEIDLRRCSLGKDGLFGFTYRQYAFHVCYLRMGFLRNCTVMRKTYALYTVVLERVG